MTRDEVYNLINGERSYQNNLPPHRSDGKDKSVGEYLTMLRHYLNAADSAWTVNRGDYEALDNIRKIAGISVRCMEEHETPPRN